MDYSFLAARLSFTFIYTCIFFLWQINSAAAATENNPHRYHIATRMTIIGVVYDTDTVRMTAV